MNILGRIWWNRKHHNQGCKGGGLRCTCGDIFSDQSSNESSAGNAITAIGNNVAQQTAVSPQQAAQTSGTYDVEQYLSQLMGQTVGQPGATAQTLTAEQQYQNQGPLAQATYNDVLAQAQNPLAGYQSALAPSLQQAQNSINEYYNARGLDNSGIAIGSMGTAGVDLAIQNAQNEMTYQQQSLQNASTLSTQTSGLAQQNLQNLTGLAGQQQQTGLTAQSMANQGLESAAQIQAYPSEAALGSAYGTEAAQNALPGQLIGAGGQLGGAMIMASALA